eukprot:767950-Hanusia_phi.AAC.2
MSDLQRKYKENRRSSRRQACPTAAGHDISKSVAVDCVKRKSTSGCDMLSPADGLHGCSYGAVEVRGWGMKGEFDDHQFQVSTPVYEERDSGLQPNNADGLRIFQCLTNFVILFLLVFGENGRTCW